MSTPPMHRPLSRLPHKPAEPEIQSIFPRIFWDMRKISQPIQPEPPIVAPPGFYFKTLKYLVAGTGFEPATFGL